MELGKQDKRRMECVGFQALLTLSRAMVANRLKPPVRLDAEQQQLAVEYAEEFVPVWQQEADFTKGETFPSIWYGSDAQVVGVQHFDLARMVLVAEKPAFT